MKRRNSDIAFSPSVKAVQERLGSRASYEKSIEKRDWSDRVTDDVAAFIAERDSFYLATANAEGQPYIQHRGGPRGFLKVLDERRLAFADFRGNRQYISVGNLDDNDRAFLFLMDYPNRQRIKLWGRAEVVEDDPELLAALADADYDGVPERAFVFHVETWNANCTQHIVPRYTAEEIEPHIRELTDLASRALAAEARIAELEAELAEARSTQPGISQRAEDRRDR